ncbi:MAG: ferredoxin [Pseudomonas sp.]|nr:ferredoxin [Pseudomonas sp.]MPT20587.1 ferredoxin [Pseudomonas sp.]
MPSRNTWGLLIFDREQRQLYRCTTSNFWELDDVSYTTVLGRYSPLTSDAEQQASLATLKASAEIEPLHPLGDLWLPEHLWQRYHDQLLPRTLSAPDAPYVLLGQPCLPDSLLALADPLAPLHSPILALSLDGRDCGLFMPFGDDNLAWRAGDQALVVRAAPTAETEAQYWYWQEGDNWRRLGTPWQRLDQEPHCLRGELLTVDATHAHLGLGLAQPRLSNDAWGELNSYSYSSLELASQHGEDGRPKTHEAAQPQLELLLPLDGGTGRSACPLQSAPLANGQRAIWRWLHDDRDGTRGAYSITLGDWQLEGQWTLDHRVSDCGHYLALVSFAETPQVARLAIAHLAQRRLTWADTELADIQLQGFIDGQVHLIHLLGLRRERHFGEPGWNNLPYQLDQHLPEDPASWHSFARCHDGLRRVYAQARIGLDGMAWQRVPIRLATQPPAAWWQGEFTLPAPDGQDRAWAFGFERDRLEVGNEWREFARNGYLLTASGIGLTHLATPMIWSSDGRYLALLRHVDRIEDNSLEDDQWRLLLLDVQDRSLRRFADDMGLWPRFESFGGDLCYSNLGVDLRQAQRRVIRLKDLLRTPATPLRNQAGRWLEEQELQRAQDWAALPTPRLDQ